MSYIWEESKVIYKSKGGTNTKEFDTVDFIASLVSHISNKNEQMVGYYGFYSNVCRGKRQKDNVNDIEFIIRDTENTIGLK